MERRDPEFDKRKAEVLEVYAAAEVPRALPEAELLSPFGAALICQVQDDGGSFDMVSRGGARPVSSDRVDPVLSRKDTLALPGMLHLALCNQPCGWLTQSWPPCQHDAKCELFSISSKASASDTRSNRQNHSPVCRW